MSKILVELVFQDDKPYSNYEPQIVDKLEDEVVFPYHLSGKDVVIIGIKVNGTQALVKTPTRIAVGDQLWFKNLDYSFSEI